MKKNDEIRYILFKYAASLAQESCHAVAAVTLSTFSDGTSVLGVHVLPNWEGVAAADDYLLLAKDILKDWESISPMDAEHVFSELDNIFNGPLRSYESGTCLEHDFPTILNGAFKTECRQLS